MSAPAPQPPRIGPRPLPLHLMAAIGSFASSQAALPLLRSGWPGWNPELAGRAGTLAASLAAVGIDALATAVDAELAARAELFLKGIERYRHHAYRRDLPDPPAVWREGTTRLLDYGEGGESLPVLVVPSLINRAYILDLMPGKSLLRALASRGLRPLLVDWDEPGPVERNFTLTDYIAGRLDRALAAAHALTGRPVAVIGYCMGGLLALALALRRPNRVSALALLATPWDFHAERAEQARLIGALAPVLEAAFRGTGEMPVDILQALFAALDPLLALRKFSRFAAMADPSARADEFVALEDWLNDGVPLALKVAEECLADWYGENLTAQGAWRVAGRAVDPRASSVPALIVVPAQDRIVPPQSARALAAALPQAEVLSPAQGHIGMVVSESAPAAVWRPLAEWLLAHGSNARKPGRPAESGRNRSRAPAKSPHARKPARSGR